MELHLHFSDRDRLVVQWGDATAEPRTFVVPLTRANLNDIRWYLEVYGTLYITEVDNARAEQLVARLPEWGAALFEAVFATDKERDGFEQFCQVEGERGARVVTVRASDASVLALPWELLRVPDGSFLIEEPLNLSIRRCFESGSTVAVPKQAPKERLRLLFVVSRPAGVGFLDPRADALAVMDALDEMETGCVDVEFLRPATVPQLTQRLNDPHLPSIDILHFDGHGVFKVENNAGYLLFAQQVADRLIRNEVKAAKLGKKLAKANIPLVVLSACQSAQVGREEALGSVAIELLRVGVPSVLAMTHSVLAETTKRLFGAFYSNLARGLGIAAALDWARQVLREDALRGTRQWGQEEFALHLQDWFLPVLYQADTDMPLIASGNGARRAQAEQARPPWELLLPLPPLPQVGFWGRSLELWQLEQAFVLGARRVTMSGFSGQGKTALAAELGRWLVRTRLFKQACFVSYDGFQGMDPVEYAVAIAFGVTDEAAVKALLESVPTLLILDNLETLEGEGLARLLSVAAEWSRLGESRVLLTTRSGTLPHPEEPVATRGECVSFSLGGLSRRDALVLCQELMRVSPPLHGLPEREKILDFFELVDFHPLSIQLLTWQLGERPMRDAREELERLLVEGSKTDKERGLFASLNLSLNRLESEQRRLVRRLGIFQSGAFENELLKITKIAKEDWHSLRTSLEMAGLLTVEQLLDITSPFLKFHPTLVTVLQQELTDEELHDLTTRHCQSYYRLSENLYKIDRKNPSKARSIFKKELPNLLAAVHRSLASNDKDGIAFADKINWFLDLLDLNRERTQLLHLSEAAAQEVGSPSWFTFQSNRGEQLYSNSGTSKEQPEAAKVVFNEILSHLPSGSIYERCMTLNSLGRCEQEIGQTGNAIFDYRQALTLLAQLDPSELVTRLIGIIQTDLGGALAEISDFSEAKIAYQKALEIAEEQSDIRQKAVVIGQLGLLELHQGVEGDLIQAEKLTREALSLFRDDPNCREPASEAIYLYQLGIVYQTLHQLDAAEMAYREAAQIDVAYGNFVNAATSWTGLAGVNQLKGKFDEAEAWYRKAIEQVYRPTGNITGLSLALGNLANVLQSQPDRLDEARTIAEEALSIDRTLDPKSSNLLATYTILAEIAEQQNEIETARYYRREHRTLYCTLQYPQLLHELQPFIPVIHDVVIAATDGFTSQRLETALLELIDDDYTALVTAIRQILNGEWDEALLYEPLDLEESMIILAILCGIKDPAKRSLLLASAR